MDPALSLLGTAPKAIEAALSLVSAYRAHQDAREAELRLLRVLYFEVCRNLGVLDRFHIADRAGIPSNDEAYCGVAKLLTIDAHLAVVLVRRESESEREAVRQERERALADKEETAAEREQRALRDRRERERLEAFRATWGDLCDASWVLDGGAGADPDGDPDDPTLPAPSKLTTMLRSLAFVSVKVPVLATLADVDDATRAVMRDVRVAVRLEQIRQHESALKRRLEALPVITSVRV